MCVSGLLQASYIVLKISPMWRYWRSSKADAVIVTTSVTIYYWYCSVILKNHQDHVLLFICYYYQPSSCPSFCEWERACACLCAWLHVSVCLWVRACVCVCDREIQVVSNCCVHEVVQCTSLNKLISLGLPYLKNVGQVVITEWTFSEIRERRRERRKDVNATARVLFRFFMSLFACLVVFFFSIDGSELDKDGIWYRITCVGFCLFNVDLLCNHFCAGREF